MTALIGTATTNSASRYLQQLAKHWAHKFEVTFDPEHAIIALPIGRVEMTASSETLTAILNSQEGDADRLREVFENHINRFAFREAPLPFVWSRPS